MNELAALVPMVMRDDAQVPIAVVVWRVCSSSSAIVAMSSSRVGNTVPFNAASICKEASWRLASMASLVALIRSAAVKLEVERLSVAVVSAATCGVASCAALPTAFTAGVTSSAATVNVSVV